MESVGEVSFFSRLQIRGAIIHSRSYKRVSRRNNYTVVYQEGNSTFMGKLKCFLLPKMFLECAVERQFPECQYPVKFCFRGLILYDEACVSPY